MGMGFPFGSARRSGACGDYSQSAPPTKALAKKAAPKPAPGDPVPARFAITRTHVAGPYIVAEIVWPDAKNYDGRKVAVYRATLAQLAAATLLDPHFAEKRGPLVPLARFEPTNRGWAMAVSMATYEATQ